MITKKRGIYICTSIYTVVYVLEGYDCTYSCYLDKLTILNKLLRILQKNDVLFVMKVSICSIILCLKILFNYQV